MIKWAVELTPYGINYEPRRAIKAQGLAEFIAECSIRFPENRLLEGPLLH